MVPFQPATQLTGADYFPTTHCATGTANVTTGAINSLVDKNTSSCVSDRIVHDEEELFLQATFSFGVYNSWDMLSVEVILEDTLDCTSVIWTWFVGPVSSSGPFLECYANLLFQNDDSTTCLVTCSCETSCESVKLYLKYNQAQFSEERKHFVCEISLRYGSVEPRVNN